MTARIDPNKLRDDELLIERTFDAPVALVFRVWADRDHMMRWLGPKDFTCTHLDYRLPRSAANGAPVSLPTQYGESWMGGEFKEIEKNKRIVYTFAWDGETMTNTAIETIITVTFAEKDGKTLQSFHQTPFNLGRVARQPYGGWDESFDREQTYLENIAKA